MVNAPKIVLISNDGTSCEVSLFHIELCSLFNINDIAETLHTPFDTTSLKRLIELCGYYRRHGVHIPVKSPYNLSTWEEEYAQELSVDDLESVLKVANELLCYPVVFYISTVLKMRIREEYNKRFVYNDR